MPSKLCLTDAKRLATDRKGRCLSKHYLNSKDKLDWQCEAKHRWSASFDNIRAGSWCPDCGGRRRLTIADMQALAIGRGGLCLSAEYKDAATRLTWQCEQKHTWEATGSSIRNSGTWCPHCSGRRRLSLAFFQKHAESLGGKCLATSYKNNQTPMQWQCKNGHTWSSPATNIRSGHWCRQCNLDDWKPKHKLPLERLQAMAKSKGGACLAEIHKNTSTRVRWRCSQGHIWLATASSVLGGSWCNECATGVGERICRAYFEAIFAAPFPKSPPPWLLGPKRALELDGYCEKLKIAFEHQGDQHFDLTTPWIREKTALSHRMKVDKRKKELCEQHGVRLFLIPQISSKLPLPKFRKFIKDTCRSFHIPVPRRIDKVEIDLRSAYSPPRLADLQKIASDQGGALLSTIFHGENEWHEWQCAFGHSWSARAKSVRNGSWCHDCAGNKKGDLESFKDLAIAKGGRCISRKYVNAHDPLTWECKALHRWSANADVIKRGNWCPHCAGNARGTIEEMRAIAKMKKGKCLSDEYISSQSLLHWQCENGHKWQASPGNVKAGTWCRQCFHASRPKKYPRIISSGYERGSIASMQKIAKSRGGACTSKVYKSSTEHLNWKCEAGHTWRATPQNVKNGHWCPRCAGHPAKSSRQVSS